MEWLSETWPALLARAKSIDALILFGDEASFAQWGSLGYTWAPVGQQPLVKTTGKRKAYKTFGLIEFFSGRLFYQGIEGKFNADSYIAFLSQVLAQTHEPLFLVHDNAPYHRRCQGAAVHEGACRSPERRTTCPATLPTTTQSSSSGVRSSAVLLTTATSRPLTCC